MNDYINIDFTAIFNYLINIVLTIFIGLIVVKITKLTIYKILTKTKLDITLINFIISVTNPLIYIIYLISILDSFGIPLTGITAIVATSGVAISLGIQDSLSNIASGVLLIMTKPFKVGDYICILDVEGSVETISLVMTTLTTPDKKVITIPNKEMTDNRIINTTLSKKRRLDLEFCITSSCDVELVKSVLLDTMLNNKLVIKDMEIKISLKEYSEMGLIFMCRPWVNNCDYWDLRFTIVEDINKAFLNNNIDIAYNRVNVLLIDNNLN